MDQALVQLSNIRCHLNRLSHFQKLNWTLKRNENWVFYGPNGCGKTALGKVLSGQLPISSGERIYAAAFNPTTDIQWVSTDAQKALKDHDHRFDDSETRADAHDEGTRVSDIIFGKKTPGTAALQWLDKLHMSAHLDRGIRYISSGQLRKTLLLKAYIDTPKVLIIDDPMAGLDVESQQSVRDLVQVIAESSSQLILLLRRRQDIVDGITHIAELKALQIISAGKRSPNWENAQVNHSSTPTKFELSPAKPREPFATGTNLIKLAKVTANYHDSIIFKGLNFEVNARQHCSISGPNGCGKSTLMQIISAENSMAYGQDIWLFGSKRGGGESIWDVKTNFGEVSNRVHEQYGRGWSVQQVLISGLYDSIGLYKTPANSDMARAKTCLKNFDIGCKGDTLYTRLSYGQQRLILLARAMIKVPPILLLDEALTGLDEEHQTAFLNMLQHIVDNTDVTVINITHRQAEQPAFIKQHWRFIDDIDGRYNLALTGK